MKFPIVQAHQSPVNQRPLPDEYLNPSIMAKIIMVVIKQIIHLAACLLSAFLSTFSKCSFAFTTWVKVSSMLKSILSISDPWWMTNSFSYLYTVVSWFIDFTSYWMPTFFSSSTSICYSVMNISKSPPPRILYCSSVFSWIALFIVPFSYVFSR